MFFYYILFINLLSFSFMGIDKYKAIHHKWRISEKTLFVSALLLGSVGSIAGMYVFRHKTKHKQFVWYASYLSFSAFILSLVALHFGCFKVILKAFQAALIF